MPKLLLIDKISNVCSFLLLHVYTFSMNRHGNLWAVKQEKIGSPAQNQMIAQFTTLFVIASPCVYDYVTW